MRVSKVTVKRLCRALAFVVNREERQQAEERICRILCSMDGKDPSQVIVVGSTQYYQWQTYKDEAKNILDMGDFQ